MNFAHDSILVMLETAATGGLEKSSAGLLAAAAAVGTPVALIVAPADGLITQIAGPVARQGDADARDRAAELAREIAALSVSLHSTLVTVAVRHALEP